MRKWIKGLLVSSAMTLSLSSTAYAGNWWLDMNGWWYQEADGSYAKDGWNWIDGDDDGIAECYYFTHKGYLVDGQNEVDGYETNKDGAWTVKGVVQTKDVSMPNDPAAVAIYQEAEAKCNALDGIDADVDATITMSIEGDSDSMAYHLNMKMRGLQSDALEYKMDGTLDMFNDSYPFSAFYTDGYSYIDMMGIKMKQALPIESAKAAAQIKAGDSLATISNLQVRDEGGNKILTYDMKTAVANEMLNGLLPMSDLTNLEGYGIDISYKFKKAYGEIVVNAEGYCVFQSVYMDMEMSLSAEGKTMTLGYIMDMDMKINNPGQAVTFKLPSTKDFVDVNVYDYPVLE